MKGGDSGEPVLVTDPDAGITYFGADQAASSDGLKLVAIHHIFGSEEQSARSAVIQKRIPQSCVFVSQKDADSLGLKDQAQVTLGQVTVNLPVRISESLPAGFCRCAVCSSRYQHQARSRLR